MFTLEQQLKSEYRAAMPQPQHFGTFLRSNRKVRGISQQQLADAAGISHTYVSKIEGGLLVPSEEALKAFAECLGIDPDEMLSRAGRAPSDVVEILAARPDLSKKIRQGAA